MLRPPVGPPPGWTPALQIIKPLHPTAALPMTLYIGEIPKDLTDNDLQDILKVRNDVSYLLLYII